MNREKTLRYVLIAVGAVILALLALQFWLVKNKRHIFQGTVTAALTSIEGAHANIVLDPNAEILERRVNVPGSS